MQATWLGAWSEWARMVRGRHLDGLLAACCLRRWLLLLQEFPAYLVLGDRCATLPPWSASVPDASGASGGLRGGSRQGCPARH